MLASPSITTGRSTARLFADDRAVLAGPLPVRVDGVLLGSGVFGVQPVPKYF